MFIFILPYARDVKFACSFLKIYSGSFCSFLKMLQSDPEKVQHFLPFTKHKSESFPCDLFIVFILSQHADTEYISCVHLSVVCNT